MGISRKSNIKEKSCKSGFEQTIEYVLQQTIRAEQKARDIYMQFSQIFCRFHNVCHFWSDLAQDEDKHAEELQRILKSLSYEQLNQVPDSALLDGTGKIMVLLGSQDLGVIETLDDAYEFAHELESSEISSVFKFLATEFISTETQRRLVITHLGNHIRKLTEFTEKFGGKSWRKGITAQYGVSKEQWFTGIYSCKLNCIQL